MGPNLNAAPSLESAPEKFAPSYELRSDLFGAFGIDSAVRTNQILARVWTDYRQGVPSKWGKQRPLDLGSALPEGVRVEDMDGWAAEQLGE